MEHFVTFPPDKCILNSALDSKQEGSINFHFKHLGSFSTFENKQNSFIFWPFDFSCCKNEILQQKTKKFGVQAFNFSAFGTAFHNFKHKHLKNLDKPQENEFYLQNQF